MCGLSGAMSTFLTNSELGTAHDLMLLSMFRGLHATGIAVVTRPPQGGKRPFKYLSHKAVTDAVAFLSDDKTKDLFKGPDSKVAVIGHTRHATVGEHTIQHAHPHRFKHIIGAHNGTIHKFTWGEEHKKHGTDSRVLFHMIAEEGLDKALSEAQFGAYAISYFDTKNHELCFARNKERPLHFVFSKGKQTVFWASERRMLEFALYGDRSYEDIFELNTEVVYKIPIGKPEEAQAYKLNITKPVVKTYHYKHNHNNGRYSFPQKMWDLYEYGDAWLGRDDTLLTLPKPEKKEWEGMIYKGFQGEKMSVPEALHLLDSGCSYCGSPGELHGKVFWIGKGDWVCGECSTDEFVKAYTTTFDEGSLLAWPEG